MVDNTSKFGWAMCMLVNTELENRANFEVENFITLCEVDNLPLVWYIHGRLSTRLYTLEFGIR